jgi:alkanesulfonate monooxygenase SsuD/methylene tetrahydromethanopterin reductase-like flavin-dependent oxidoreductase (luciferase family)
MRLGTLVSTPNFRHPAVLAKQVMTIDELSGGRFVLGVGAGAPGPDTFVLGAGRSSRIRRQLRLLRPQGTSAWTAGSAAPNGIQ